MVDKNDKIADLLSQYPFLKDELIKRNSAFKRLNNPIVFNTVGKFARVQDIARTAHENLDELLVFLNELIRNNQ